jgi:hypothetical protein
MRRTQPGGCCRTGAEPFISGPAEFASFYRDELAKWSGVIRTSGLRID